MICPYNKISTELDLYHYDQNMNVNFIIIIYDKEFSLPD